MCSNHAFRKFSNEIAIFFYDKIITICYFYKGYDVLWIII